MTVKTPSVDWLSEVEDEDFRAASSYLKLLYPAARAERLVAKLKIGKIKQFKAQDIFRASQLSLLGVRNSHVEKAKRKIIKSKALSPLLLVRDESNGKVTIADGYHRLCAVYGFDEDATVPCKIV